MAPVRIEEESVMETEVLVYVDIAGIPHLAGRLLTRMRKGKEGAFIVRLASCSDLL